MDITSANQDIAEYHLPSAGDYFSLLKPRVMSLVIFTAIIGLLVAPGEIHFFLWKLFYSGSCIIDGDLIAQCINPVGEGGEARGQRDQGKCFDNLLITRTMMHRLTTPLSGARSVAYGCRTRHQD